MDITSRLEFPADPGRVFAMLTDQGYLEEVCKASQAQSYDASVSGSVTRTSRTLPAPESASRFTGPHVTVVEEVAWGAAEPDGSRTGNLTLTILGQPVNMRGTMRLAPGGGGSVVNVNGDLKVSIPILGKKLEQGSAPAVLAGFRTQQEVGTAWLARPAH